MAPHQSQRSIAQQLVMRLRPLAIIVGILISMGFPSSYYALQYRSLQQRATIYAEELSRHIRDLAFETQGLWQYQAQKYLLILSRFTPYKEAMSIHIRDVEGHPIPGYTYASESSDRWWNRYAPVGSARIDFNNRTLGAVQIGLSQGALLTLRAC